MDGTTGVKGSIQVDFRGTIIGWSILADVAGSISIDVCKKAGTQALPVVPNTTTDKISASAPIALSSAQAKGVEAAGVLTWNTSVVDVGFDPVQCGIRHHDYESHALFTDSRVLRCSLLF